jgi:hypothetical protein
MQTLTYFASRSCCTVRPHSASIVAAALHNDCCTLCNLVLVVLLQTSLRSCKLALPQNENLACFSLVCDSHASAQRGYCYHFCYLSLAVLTLHTTATSKLHVATTITTTALTERRMGAT